MADMKIFIRLAGYALSFMVFFSAVCGFFWLAGIFTVDQRITATAIIAFAILYAGESIEEVLAKRLDAVLETVNNKFSDLSPDAEDSD